MQQRERADTLLATTKNTTLGCFLFTTPMVAKGHHTYRAHAFILASGMVRKYRQQVAQRGAPKG